MKKIYRLSILLFVCCYLLCATAQGQNHYHHNVVWGSLALTDTINKRLRWEVFLQHRRQNSPDNEANAFRAPQFSSYWTWVSYSLTPNVKLCLSPFGYFKSWLLAADPAELRKEPIQEVRLAIRLDHEQRYRKLTYTNRYSLERRWRDLANDGIYQPNWRVRYQARIEIPVRASWIHRPLSVTVFDEVFIQFGKAVRRNPNVFDQNRIYAGLSYGISKHLKASLGYIYQIQQRNSGKEFDHANVLFGVLTADNFFSRFRKTKKPVSVSP
nr:DUF2490 domain-containing protein [uncultured Arsenicibacter sp.]